MVLFFGNFLYLHFAFSFFSFYLPTCFFFECALHFVLNIALILCIFFSLGSRFQVVIPLCSSLINDHRYPQRLLISMSTVLITNCGSLHSEDSSSFFKSLSSNLLDLVNKMEVNVNRVSFRNFIIHLNDTIADSEGYFFSF